MKDILNIEGKINIDNKNPLIINSKDNINCNSPLNKPLLSQDNFNPELDNILSPNSYINNYISSPIFEDIPPFSNYFIFNSDNISSYLFNSNEYYHYHNFVENINNKKEIDNKNNFIDNKKNNVIDKDELNRNNNIDKNMKK